MLPMLLPIFPENRRLRDRGSMSVLKPSGDVSRNVCRRAFVALTAIAGPFLVFSSRRLFATPMSDGPPQVKRR